MKKRRILLVLSLVSVFALSFVLCSCSGQSEPASKDKILESETYEPSVDLEFLDLVDGDVEVRRVTKAPQSFEKDQAYFVNFQNENMALSVPLSLVDAASKADSYVTMRYHYPEGGDQELINFYLPAIEEYELYYPGVAAEDVSLLIGDVVVSETKSTSVRDRFTQQGYTVSQGAPIYSIEMYLINEADPAAAAIKLDMSMNELLMREKGAIDEEALDARLYLSDQDKVYSPNKMTYRDNSSAGGDFVDTYLYGSFVSTRGSLDDTGYTDIAGHYAEDAIKQAQKSFNMAGAITEGSAFEPDQAASVVDVFEATGAFDAIPTADIQTFTTMKSQVTDEYSADVAFETYFSDGEDALQNNYVSRMEEGFSAIYKKLEQEGKLDQVLDNDPSLSSRLNVALMQLSIYASNSSALYEKDPLESLPTDKDVDQWLLGVTDVAIDDPLRAYIALAVHYGLIAPDSEGKLNLYEPITRADLCLSFVNLAALVQDSAEKAQVYPGFTQAYLWARDSSLLYDAKGLWEFDQATRVDGSKYTAEEIAADEASFEFGLGKSLEKWAGDSYDGTYWFNLKDRVLTAGYANGEFESFEISEDMTELTYRYFNETDPEFDGETYVFKRAQ